MVVVLMFVVMVMMVVVVLLVVWVLMMEVMRMMGWCGMVATCEVNGLFAHLIPQEARADEEVQKARQVMIPDYRLELQASTVTGLATPGLHLAPGQTETRLAELPAPP